MICKPTRAAASIFNKLESRNQQTKTVSAYWKDIRGTDLGDDCIGRILKCKRQNPTHNTVTNFIIKEDLKSEHLVNRSLGGLKEALEMIESSE